MLTRLKQARDSLRLDNRRLKQRGGLVSHTQLLRDFEDRQDEVCHPWVGGGGRGKMTCVVVYTITSHIGIISSLILLFLNLIYLPAIPPVSFSHSMVDV